MGNDHSTRRFVATIAFIGVAASAVGCTSGGSADQEPDLPDRLHRRDDDDPGAQVPRTGAAARPQLDHRPLQDRARPGPELRQLRSGVRCLDVQLRGAPGRPADRPDAGRLRPRARSPGSSSSPASSPSPTSTSPTRKRPTSSSTSSRRMRLLGQQHLHLLAGHAVHDPRPRRRHPDGQRPAQAGSPSISASRWATPATAPRTTSSGGTSTSSTARSSPRAPARISAPTPSTIRSPTRPPDSTSRSPGTRCSATTITSIIGSFPVDADPSLGLRRVLHRRHRLGGAGRPRPPGLHFPALFNMENLRTGLRRPAVLPGVIDGSSPSGDIIGAGPVGVRRQPAEGRRRSRSPLARQDGVDPGILQHHVQPGRSRLRPGRPGASRRALPATASCRSRTCRSR